MKSLIILFILCILGVTQLAYANDTVLFAEPYVGYGVGGSLSLNSTDAGSFSAFGFGTRGGIQFGEMFFGGLDISYFPSVSYTIPSGTTAFFSSNPNNIRFGLIAGIEAPSLPLRFWVGFNLLEKVSGPVSSALGTLLGGTGDISATGTSFKFGAGYKIISNLSINAEYVAATFNTVSLSGVSSSVYSLSGKVFLLSVSTPLELSKL